MVNLFSFGCHVIDRAYASTDCTGGVGEAIKRKGGVSQACLAKSTSFTLDIHNMVNWQLSKQDSHWPVSHDHIAGSCVNSLRWFIWKLSADQLIILLDRDQCSVSYFPASLGSGHRKTDTRQCCDLLTAVKKGIRWPVSLDCIAGSGVEPSRSSVYLKLSADKVLVFKWSQAKFFVKIHMKYVAYMCRTIKILISNWPQTRKFS